MMFEEAKQLLAPHKEAIHNIAAALDRAGKLSGDQVRQLFESSALAHRSPEINPQVTGTNQPPTPVSESAFARPKLAAFDAQKEVSKHRKNRHADFSNKSHGRNSNANRLWVVKSTGKDGEKWTVKTPKNKPSFRVRPDASGFAVSLSFTDEDQKRREPYLCYLSKKEWTAAKRKSLSRFVETMLGKLDQRKADEGNNHDKIDTLITRVRGIAEV